MQWGREHGESCRVCGQNFYFLSFSFHGRDARARTHAMRACEMHTRTRAVKIKREGIDTPRVSRVAEKNIRAVHTRRYFRTAS